jgi:hypothetical protein
VRDMARPLHKWAVSQPDSALSPERWRDLTAAFDAVPDQGRRLSNNLSGASTFSGTVFSSALTTSVTVVVGGIINSPEIAELNVTLERASRLDEAISALTAFGLHVGYPGSRSPTTLLAEAHAALAKPSGPDVLEAAVLIPARESIDAALAALLKRRPTQEEAKPSKVVSIGHQCGRADLDADYYPRLDASLVKLQQKLSGAKQKKMERWEVSIAFNEALLFIIAFLKGLDPAKLKS